jgi:hypothetical protein
MTPLGVAMWQTIWKRIKRLFAPNSELIPKVDTDQPVLTDADSGNEIPSNRQLDVTLPSIVLPENLDFIDLEVTMHALFDDLCRILANHPNMREMVIKALHTDLNLGRPAIVLKEETYPTIALMMDELESREHVTNISTSSLKRYRLSEDFAEYLQSRFASS